MLNAPGAILPFLESHRFHSERRRTGTQRRFELRNTLALRVHYNIDNLWSLSRLDHAVRGLILGLRCLQGKGREVDLLLLFLLLSQ